MTMSRADAVRTYRSRLKERGLSRFEVLGRHADRELIRSLARMLAEDGHEAQRLRTALARAASGNPSSKGGIVAAVRRSPLVGADLDLSRERSEGRDVDPLMRYLLDTNIMQMRNRLLHQVDIAAVEQPDL